MLDFLFDNFITNDILNRINIFMTNMNLYYTAPKSANNKLLLNPKYNFINFLTTFTILASIIILVAALNCNIIYLIDLARENTAELDKLFPSNCQSAPYGPHYLFDKQGNPIKDDDGKISIRNICDRIYETPLDSTCSNTKVPSKKDINLCPSWPYTEFSSGDKINVVEDYVNWILRSVADTNVNFHRIIKLSLYKCTKFTNRFILIFLALIIFGLFGTIIIPAIYYFFAISINELGNFFENTAGLTKILILMTCLMVTFTFNPLYTTFQSIKLIFKLIIYPMIYDKNGVLNIFIKYKDIIAILLGGYYVVCAKKFLSSGISGFINFIYYFILVGYILFNSVTYILNKLYPK